LRGTPLERKRFGTGDVDGRFTVSGSTGTPPALPVAAPQPCRMYMANRIPTIVLVTLALLVAVPMAARSRNIRIPALESSRSTVTTVLRTGSRNAPDVADEAAMALLGTALVAAGAALRRAA
jgi:hypothetical protein